MSNDNRTVFVGNLSNSASESHLYELFLQVSFNYCKLAIMYLELV